MRLLPPFPRHFWDFEIDGVPGENALVVARPDLEGLFILNNSARFIWTSLQKSRSKESLVKEFASHFGISPSRAADDIDVTLDAWSKGLLSPARATEFVAQPPRPPVATDSLFAYNYVFGEKCFRLLVNDAEFAEEIRPRLSHLRADCTLPDITLHVIRHKGQYWVFRGEASIRGGAEVTFARTILLEEMARLSRPGTEWLTILHASVCGTDGSCIIMPAATNSGKSTLAAALMHSGLHVFSDDSAAIDRQSLQVISVPFALMLREGSWSALEPYFPELSSAPSLERNGATVRFVAPSSASCQVRTATPRCLLFIQFQPGASVRLQPISVFECLLGLQRSVFWVPHDQASIGAFLSWVQSIPAYEIIYSSLDDAVPMIRSLLAS
jgi:hypothetical protein